MVVRCPRCKSVVKWDGNPHRPFCSERCKLIDTGAWLDERHRVPCEEPDDFEEIGSEGLSPDGNRLKTN